MRYNLRENNVFFGCIFECHADFGKVAQQSMSPRGDVKSADGRAESALERKKQVGFVDEVLPRQQFGAWKTHQGADPGAMRGDLDLEERDLVSGVGAIILQLDSEALFVSRLRP